MEHQRIHPLTAYRRKREIIRVAMPQVDSEPYKQEDRPEYGEDGLF